VYDAGETATAVTVVGADAGSVASLYRASARSSRRPVLELAADRAPIEQRPVTYGLVVVATSADRRRAIDTVLWGWAHTCSGGVLLVAGPAAGAAAGALAEARKCKAGEVAGAPGWHYLYRMA
jgi:hypothetical protein